MIVLPRFKSLSRRLHAKLFLITFVHIVIHNLYAFLNLRLSLTGRFAIRTGHAACNTTCDVDRTRSWRSVLAKVLGGRQYRYHITNGNIKNLTQQKGMEASIISFDSSIKKYHPSGDIFKSNPPNLQPKYILQR
jgi:hypothetical protein